MLRYRRLFRYYRDVDAVRDHRVPQRLAWRAGYAITRQRSHDRRRDPIPGPFVRGVQIVFGSAAMLCILFVIVVLLAAL